MGNINFYCDFPRLIPEMDAPHTRLALTVARLSLRAHLSLIARAGRFTYVNASLGELRKQRKEWPSREKTQPHNSSLTASYLGRLRLRLITSSEFNGVYKSPGVQC